MSVIQVSYKFGSYKEKLELSSDLNDALQKSITHFKLNDDNKSWALYHRNKELPLTVPLRLLNLAKGATLELIEKKADINGKKLKIKFSAPGFGTEIWNGFSSTKLLEAIQEICSLRSWTFVSQELKVQCFAKVWTYDQISKSTFAQLGILEDVSLRLLIPSTEEKLDAQPQILANHTPESIIEKAVTPQCVVNPGKSSSSNTQEHDYNVSAYIPGPNSTLGVSSDQEDDFEITVSQFKKYQKMLSKTTGTNQPLLTKRLREQTAPKQTIENCNVRVRFPDRTCIDIDFKPEDTINLVYKAVAKCLSNGSSAFVLSHSHPYQELQDDDSKLVIDLNFGSKTLLVFHTEQKGPYLRPDLLEKAKPFSSTKLAEDAHSEPSSSPVPNKGEDKPSKGLRAGHTPKWLKLGKK
ncbi:LANO_0F16644g1_1 [Lachancea nothofagi CBS 11611]|uniref:LANO_0F16644g1_1 n=1 Tax=Lachancea nothofagi CBS 11611 TaxID=1266666 RepID=A0A1G4KD30_9SACH|nr:LANO_0F16644g1_1 [Lachancea nothofagi CBS 11611]